MKKKVLGKIKDSLSYVVPVKIKEYFSPYSGLIEINLTDGKRTVDTHSCNYSYGSLQKILHRGLEEIGFNDAVHDILVLGLGAGSVIETLRTHFQSKAHITAVDIDEVMIRIAREEFNLSDDKNLTIISGDCVKFMQSNVSKFDVIIVDVFIQDDVPELCLTEQFLSHIAQSLTSGGSLIFNTMRDTMERHLLESTCHILKSCGLDVRIIDRVEKTNTLILAKNFNAHGE
jgi:spermidine synthase